VGGREEDRRSDGSSGSLERHAVCLCLCSPVKNAVRAETGFFDDPKGEENGPEEGQE